MADIITYPENGITYDADDASGYLATRLSGVYSTEEDFTVTANGDLTVNVSAGQAWVRPSRFRGRSIIMEQAATLTLSAADSTRGRIDRVVLRYDSAAKGTSLKVLKGTPNSSPVAPAITRTALIYDLCLAEIRRPAGSTTIKAANITDTRLDESLCGVMRDGVTRIPTAQIQAEARARVNALEESASSSADAAEAAAKAAKASETNTSTNAQNAAGAAGAAADSATTAADQAKTAARMASAAAGSADSASGSQTAAAKSAAEALASEERAKSYADTVQATVTTDTSLRIPGAAADAKATGDALAGKASTNHTHKYAGSASAGGSANSAVKLDTSAGSATQPVYFSGGKPVACTYSLGKSVPSDALFTDHTYSNMTAATSSAAGKAGLVPAPAAGKQGQFLRGDGTWQTPTNTTYSAATQSAAGLMSAADKKKLDGFTLKAQTTDPGAGSTLTTGTVLLVYK